MKKQNDNSNTQAQKACFPIKFSAAVIWLCVAVYALCAAGIAVSVWQIVNVGVHGFTQALQYPFLIAISVFCIALVSSILIRSQYVVDDTYLFSQYGFIKSKFQIKSITSILLDSDEKKLTVYFNEQFMVITVSPEWNEAFVRALLNVNKDIEYSFTLSEPSNEENNEK